MSNVLKDIDSRVDKSIHSQLPNLGKQLYHRIQEICLELQHHFPNIEFRSLAEEAKIANVFSNFKKSIRGISAFV